MDNHDTAICAEIYCVRYSERVFKLLNEIHLNKRIVQGKVTVLFEQKFPKNITIYIQLSNHNPKLVISYMSLKK